jgi:membrane-bound serine protease (ClpP class)
VHVSLVVTVTVLLGGFWAIAVSKAMAVRRAPVTVGPQEIVGMTGVVRPGGQVFVRGELWRARSQARLEAGERVVVDGMDGLTLVVHPDDGPAARASQNESADAMRSQT